MFLKNLPSNFQINRLSHYYYCFYRVIMYIKRNEFTDLLNWQNDRTSDKIHQKTQLYLSNSFLQRALNESERTLICVLQWQGTTLIFTPPHASWALFLAAIVLWYYHIQGVCDSIDLCRLFSPETKKQYKLYDMLKKVNYYKKKECVY